MFEAVPFSWVFGCCRLVQVVDEISLALLVNSGLPTVGQPIVACPAVRGWNPATENVSEEKMSQ